MKVTTLILFFALTVGCIKGQTVDSVQLLPKPFTVSYSLSIKSNKNDGVAESYNGAIKTIFIGDNKARSRMVSLMRVQSIFYQESKTVPVITIVKESGKKYKRVLDNKGWAKMNNQYEGVKYEFAEDSIFILDYVCKKVQLNLKGNRIITAYYTTQLQNPLFGKIEPAFAGVPGIVLKYEYENDDAVFTYTALDISFNPIAAEIYKIP